MVVFELVEAKQQKSSWRHKYPMTWLKQLKQYCQKEISVSGLLCIPIIIQNSRSLYFYQFQHNSSALIQIIEFLLNNLCNQITIGVSKCFITFELLICFKRHLKTQFPWLSTSLHAYIHTDAGYLLYSSAGKVYEFLCEYCFLNSWT